MATLIVSDAMKHGIKGVKKRKLKYGKKYHEGAGKITRLIEEDHQRYTETYNRAMNYTAR